MKTSNVNLEVTTFEKKVEELLNSDKKWAIHYDVGHDQITIVELAGDDTIVWHSPYICQMPEKEYIPFRANLERLMPEAKPQLERYW